MKRLIQICTMLALVAAFTVAANAQTEKKYDTQIPFDFAIGQKYFKAGSYAITVTRMSAGGTIATLSSKADDQFQTFHVFTSGEVSKGEPHLIFTRYENQSFLTKILTSEKSFTIPMSKAEKQIAGKTRNNNLKKQVAVAYLNR